MTPEEAEAALPKIAEAPDPTEFDPIEETRWSLFMVLGWIMWRTPEAVRNQWDAYRMECDANDCSCRLALACPGWVWFL